MSHWQPSAASQHASEGIPSIAAAPRRRPTGPTATPPPPRLAGRRSLTVVAGNPGAGGPFAPLVVVTRNIMGTKEFNQFRGKMISLHSQGARHGCGVAAGCWAARALRAQPCAARAACVCPPSRPENTCWRAMSASAAVGVVPLGDRRGRAVPRGCSRQPSLPPSLVPPPLPPTTIPPPLTTNLPVPPPPAVIKDFCKQLGADSKQVQGLIRLAKKNGEKLGFLA